MDVALSRNGRRGLRVLFLAVIAFLYAPIAILLLFSFNDSVLPTFPLSGFTLEWYRQFVHDPELIGALETSALVAALSSAGAVALGTLASIALARRRFFGKAAASAFLLSPLVIPYIVFGIALLLLFHTLGIQRSVLTVVIGHIVISLPYTILVLVPRLQQIDLSLEEAAYDLGADHDEQRERHHDDGDRDHLGQAAREAERGVEVDRERDPRADHERRDRIFVEGGRERDQERRHDRGQDERQRDRAEGAEATRAQVERRLLERHVDLVEPGHEDEDRVRQADHDVPDHDG